MDGAVGARAAREGKERVNKEENGEGKFTEGHGREVRAHKWREARTVETLTSVCDEGARRGQEERSQVLKRDAGEEKEDGRHKRKPEIVDARRIQKHRAQTIQPSRVTGLTGVHTQPRHSSGNGDPRPP